MPEKFDFSKISAEGGSASGGEDQKDFESLPQEEKDKIVGEAQEEATQQQERIESDKEKDYSVAERLVEEEKKQESQEIALEKLEILMKDDFYDFGIRFANKGEYENIMKGDSYRSREVYVPKIEHELKGQEQVNFKEYLQKALDKKTLTGWVRRGWLNAIKKQTNWDHSFNDLLSYDYLLEQLKEAHKEAKILMKEQEDENLRLKAMEKFREEIIHGSRERIEFGMAKVENPTAIIDKINLAEEFEGRLKGATTNQEIFDKLKLITENYTQQEDDYGFKRERAEAEIRNLLKNKLKSEILHEVDPLIDGYLRYSKAIREIGSKHLGVIQKFLDDPSFLEDKANLRLLMEALSYKPGRTGGIRERRSYHLALIMDMKNISKDTSWGHEEWRPLQEENQLLGVISIMPNKELIKEVIEKSSSGGKIAHPVFDFLGHVRWPKEIENEKST